MRFAPLWLVILFLGVAASDSTSSLAESRSDAESEKSPEDEQSQSPAEKSFKKNDESSHELGNDNKYEGQETYLPLQLILLESLFNGNDKLVKENNETNSDTDKVKDNQSTGVTESNPENPVESKISSDLIDIRRQGEINSSDKQKKSGSDTQFDDSKAEVTSNSVPRFGQRSRKSKQKTQDDIPLLQLTQGGYDSPYKRSRFRNRFIPRTDSSEQSENIQKPERISTNRQSDIRSIMPQVTYSVVQQPPYAFGHGPVMNPGFDASARNILAVNHVLPASAQDRFLNSPTTDFTGYTTTAFQPQLSQNGDEGGFSNYMDPNNIDLYQASQPNSFQAPGMLFHPTPQIQAQSLLFDPRNNIQPQFQQNPFASYPRFENVEGSTTPNYAPFIRNPAGNGPFQVPPNFFANIPNRDNAFNNAPIGFVSNYPNSDERVQSQLLRYPVMANVQNTRQFSSDQQLDSEASQEDTKSKINVQKTDKPANRDDVPSAPFGTRLQVENEDVYMRYPTDEAGYATEENLPSQNNSQEAKDNNQQITSEPINSQSSDPYRNIRNNQRINNSFDFPPEFFRDVPINFGYQRPQNGIFTQYPDRSRGISHYPSPNFESRTPFNPVPLLPQNNYQYLDVNNQQRTLPEADGTPACAKENNASICFEDNDYPRNDILYSFSSNSFLADRLSGPDLSVNSFAFVERNNASESDQNEENYACAVNTIYGAPLRAKNLDGVWSTIVNIPGKFSQPVRMEICKSLGDSCSYAAPNIKTTCVQKYSLQRLLIWSLSRGFYSDIFKIPVACSCQIIKVTIQVN